MKLNELKPEVEKLGWSLKINHKLKRQVISWANAHNKEVAVISVWDDWPTKTKEWAAKVLMQIERINASGGVTKKKRRMKNEEFLGKRNWQYKPNGFGYSIGSFLTKADLFASDKEIKSQVLNELTPGEEVANGGEIRIYEWQQVGRKVESVVIRRIEVEPTLAT